MTKAFTWERVERLANRKGYDLEYCWASGVKVYSIRRLNWRSSWYQEPEGLKLYLENRAIDWGKGYIP